MNNLGKKYHLRMLAESVSQRSMKLNTVNDDVSERKCFGKIISSILFHSKMILKRLCC